MGGELLRNLKEITLDWTQVLAIVLPVMFAIIIHVFEATDAYWRGLGMIPRSGLKIRDKLKEFNAQNRFDLSVENVMEPKGCACGEVLSGLSSPVECTLFGKICTPDDPIGPCMVSTEGTCAAYFKYHQFDDH